MPRIRVDITALIIASLVLLLVVVYFPFQHPSARTLEEILRSGKLVVLTQNNPTTYYINRDGKKAGPEYKLARYFAEALGVEVHFKVKSSVTDLMQAIVEGEGDIAAAGLSVTEERKNRFLFSNSYQEVSQQVVCRRGGANPKRIADLPGVELVVISGSSYEERLKQLKTLHPDLHWEVTEGVSAELLLEKVWCKQIDCTVLDSNIVAINRRYYPELQVRFELGPIDNLAWLLPQESKSLQKKINKWFGTGDAATRKAEINEQYYGHVELFDYVDTAAFIRRLSSRYPSYKAYFQEAAETYGLPESLLAAQGYQESHWNPKAKSPTGVRGIMMLTLTTARAMGVESRLNPEQSIMGGAKYLAQLKSRLSEKIAEPDLTWFALAAYNVGMGHLRDAQKLAAHYKDDPHSWHDVKEYLPLLSDPIYYKFMKYGYARGSEPVAYVDQVRQYEEIMIQHLSQQSEKQEYREDQALAAENNENLQSVDKSGIFN